jgi:signal transduction histidine kinase
MRGAPPSPSNLLANAIDALPPGGVITLRIKKCEREIHLTILDNGPGIPQAILKQVFEPFLRRKGSKELALALPSPNRLWNVTTAE